MFRKKQPKNKIESIDSRIYKYWQALYLSLYSGKLYVDVAKRWKGIGMTYGLVLLMVVTIPLAVKSMINFNQYIGQDLLQPMSEIPEFSLINGRVLFNHAMPYLIKNKKGQVIVIIDTTGKINKITDEYPQLVMLINSSKYFFREPKLEFLKNDKKNAKFYSNREIKTYDLSDLADETFNGEDWLQVTGLTAMKNSLLIFVYPVLVSATYGIIITMLIIFSMMGQLAAYSIFKHKLYFKQACRLMMVSSSLGITAFLIFRTLDINTKQANFFCMALVFIYFSFAVLSIRRDSKRLVHF